MKVAEKSPRTLRTCMQSTASRCGTRLTQQNRQTGTERNGRADLALQCAVGHLETSSIISANLCRPAISCFMRSFCDVVCKGETSCRGGPTGARTKIMPGSPAQAGSKYDAGVTGAVEELTS